MKFILVLALVILCTGCQSKEERKKEVISYYWEQVQACKDLKNSGYETNMNCMVFANNQVAARYN